MQRTNRRIFLNSLGATLILPTLPSATRRMAGSRVLGSEPSRDSVENDKNSVRRFCCIYFPNGVSLPPKDHPAHEDWHWFPHETGSDYRLTKVLESLAPFRSELTILSGLSHPATRSMVGHATGDTFLTGADQSKNYVNSVSLDQVLASVVGGQTRFPSLTLSSDGGVGTPGRAKTMSFTFSGKPIPSLSNPRQIFNRMFGVSERSLEEQRQAFGQDRSILDSVLSEARTLKNHLAGSDQKRLDEYMTSVREIERRLARADHWLDVQKPLVDENHFDLDVTPAEGGEDYIRVILDLMYMAMLTDSTRSITYQITSEDAKGIGDRFPNTIGLKGHHNLSHGAGNKNGYEDWAKYDQFLTNQLAYFLQRLQADEDPEGDGTLLDNTMVYYGCGTSRTHQAVNYPLILAGARNMGLKHGQHRRFEESTIPISNLYVAMLQQLGVPVDQFADSTGSLDEILA